MHKFCTYVNFCVSFDRYMQFKKSVLDFFWIKLIVLCSTVQYGFMHTSFGFLWNAEVQNFCVSFDGYMHIEKSVLGFFWIKLVVLCSTVHMDLCPQVLEFAVNAEVQNFCVSFDRYVHIEKCGGTLGLD